MTHVMHSAFKHWLVFARHRKSKALHFNKAFWSGRIVVVFQKIEFTRSSAATNPPRSPSVLNCFPRDNWKTSRWQLSTAALSVCCHPPSLTLFFLCHPNISTTSLQAGMSGMRQPFIRGSPLVAFRQRFTVSSAITPHACKWTAIKRQKWMLCCSYSWESPCMCRATHTQTYTHHFQSFSLQTETFRRKKTMTHTHRAYHHQSARPTNFPVWIHPK